MDVNKIKNDIRREISLWVGDKQKLTASFVKERAELFFQHQGEEGNYLDVDKVTKDRIVNSLCADYLGLGPLQRLMEDEDITEIMVNGPYKVYIEKKGKKFLSNVEFENEAHLRYIVEKMISPTGRRIDESSPYADFSLEDGSRVNIILPPLAVKGATLTIRKFLKSIQNAKDLIKFGTIDEKIAKFLIACIRAKVNILFSGATGSGKTTTLEALASYLDPEERIITIEDALELTLAQEHLVQLLTRPPNIEGKGEITPRDLFRNTLRMRPTRIILGEIRGGEAMEYLQALNSGHRGCLAVIHAATPADTITRLETMALYASLNLPTWAIREQIASGIDLIIQHEQLTDGSRKLTYLTEVESLKDNKIILRDLFRYEVEEVTSDLKVKGEFKVINKPNFFPIFKRRGVKIDESIFSKKD